MLRPLQLRLSFSLLDRLLIPVEGPSAQRWFALGLIHTEISSLWRLDNELKRRRRDGTRPRRTITPLSGRYSVTQEATPGPGPIRVGQLKLRNRCVVARRMQATHQVATSLIVRAFLHVISIALRTSPFFKA